jgi:hypothetical protein
MTDNSQFLLGQLVERSERMENDVSEIKNRLGTIETSLAEKRGADKAKHRRMAALGGIAGSVVTGAVTLITKVWLAYHAGPR